MIAQLLLLEGSADAPRPFQAKLTNLLFCYLTLQNNSLLSHSLASQILNIDSEFFKECNGQDHITHLYRVFIVSPFHHDNSAMNQ